MKIKEDPLVKGFIINIFGNISRATRPVFIFLLARLYSVEVFSLFSISLAIVEFLHSISIFGLEDACYKFVPPNVKKKELLPVTRTLIISAFSLSFILFFLTLLFLPYLRTHYIKSADISLPLKFTLVLLLTQGLSKIFLAHTKALKIMEYSMLTMDVIEPLNILLFFLLFYFIPYTKPYAPYMAYPSASIITLFISFYFYAKEFKLQSSVILGKPLIRGDVLKYSFLLGATNIMSGGLKKVDIIIAGYFLDVFYVGIYSLSFEVANMFMKIRTAFNPILSPIISEHHSRNEKEKAFERLKQSEYIAFVMSAPVLFTYIFAGKQILSLFGKDYNLSYIPLLILSGGQFINNFLGQVYQFVAITGKPHMSAMVSFFDLFTRTLFCFLLIPYFGIKGAALGTATGNALSKLPLLLYIKKTFNRFPFIKEQILDFSFAGVLALFLYLVIYFNPLFVREIYRLIIFLLLYTGIYFSFILSKRKKFIIKEAE